MCWTGEDHIDYNIRKIITDKFIKSIRFCKCSVYKSLNRVKISGESGWRRQG